MTERQERCEERTAPQDRKPSNFRHLFGRHVHCQGKDESFADTVILALWRPVGLGLLLGVPLGLAFYKFIVGKRYPTAAHIPPEAFTRRQVIRGKVISVGDSDNFRLYHTPGLGWGLWRKIPTAKKELAKQTIMVRLAGVDAPEGAHFGMPAQPFSTESKQFLTDMVHGRHVKVQLLKRDHYGRAVAMVNVRKPPFFLSKNVSVEMLRAGLASIYVAQGAEYGGISSTLEKVQEKARRRRLGIWSKKSFVSPGDHKAKFLRGVNKDED
ncbi:putative endonuclease lcl3 [Apophysomyces ossiformis]|uniref:Putative endonuclease lcl3 n=1 Tax=Apophysomyces ossiformis TaxID=679940 RepID=A0A8H7BZW8_9FUNG|nr:putative endonuclease lcl3 [Apophysomyces ossiformis]